MKRFLAILLTALLCAALLTACSEKTLKLDKNEVELAVGDSVKLSAGRAVKVHWSSSDSDVASVHAGTVAAKAPGTAVITASLESGAKAECKVTVVDKLITGIKLNPASARVDEGSTIQIAVTYTPADASHIALSWSSSDEEVATVDEQGYVTAVWWGSAVITCKSDNGVEATCAVTVGAPPVEPTQPPTQPPATEKPTEAASPTEAPESPQPDSGESASYEDGFLFPESSSRYLSAEEIRSRFNSVSSPPVSSSYKQDAVNEIFARHGYVFRSASIRAYYESQSWYTPDPTYDGTLSYIEQYNISLLSNY